MTSLKIIPLPLVIKLSVKFTLYPLSCHDKVIIILKHDFKCLTALKEMTLTMYITNVIMCTNCSTRTRLMDYRMSMKLKGMGGWGKPKMFQLHWEMEDGMREPQKGALLLM